jgi:hypothetical protein
MRPVIFKPTHVIALHRAHRAHQARQVRLRPRPTVIEIDNNHV